MKSVPFKPNGEPIDEEYTKYNRFFNGQELLIFDDFLEYAIFIGLINPNVEDENIIEGDANLEKN